MVNVYNLTTSQSVRSVIIGLNQWTCSCDPVRKHTSTFNFTFDTLHICWSFEDCNENLNEWLEETECCAGANSAVWLMLHPKGTFCKIYSQPPPDCWRCLSSALNVRSSLQVTSDVMESGCGWESRPDHLCTTSSSSLLLGGCPHCQNCASPPENTHKQRLLYYIDH